MKCDNFLGGLVRVWWWWRRGVQEVKVNKGMAEHTAPCPMVCGVLPVHVAPLQPELPPLLFFTTLGGQEITAPSPCRYSAFGFHLVPVLFFITQLAVFNSYVDCLANTLWTLEHWPNDRLNLLRDRPSSRLSLDRCQRSA